MQVRPPRFYGERGERGERRKVGRGIQLAAKELRGYALLRSFGQMSLVTRVAHFMEAHVDQDVNPQTVNPETYNEHHPNMQAPTPQHPNPENEPSVFGPFGTTEWLNQLEAAFKRGEITSLGSQSQQTRPQAVQGGQPSQGSQEGGKPQQYSQAVRALLQRGGITSIRCTPQKLFVVQTKDGVTYESPSLRAALKQIPGLDLSQPFSVQGQQGTSTQNAGAQERSGQGNASESASGMSAQQPGRSGQGQNGQGGLNQPSPNAGATPQAKQPPTNLPPR